MSRRQSLAAGAGGVLVLVVLVLQLLAIDHQRRLAISQERSIQTLLDRTRAAEREARPLLADARELAPELERAGRAAAGTLSAARPLIDGLVAADAPGAVRRGEALAVRASSLLEQLTEQRVVPALTRLELLPRVAEILRQSRDMQQRSLDVQVRTLAVLERSLAVQEETLVHARNLDRRTGGDLGGP